MNISSAGIGQRLATAGRKAMYSRGVTTGQEQTRIGGQYLAAVRDQSDVRIEKELTRVAIQSFNNVDRWRAQVALADYALAAVSAGVGGSMGFALAHLGAEVMYARGVETVGDQATIALTFTQAVAQSSEDPVQRTLASTALKSAQNVDYARTQVGILGEFLTSQTAPQSQPLSA